MLQIAKLAIMGPIAAVVGGCRYTASCMQVFCSAILAGARLAPTVQQTAMEAGSQVRDAEPNHKVSCTAVEMFCRLHEQSLKRAGYEHLRLSPKQRCDAETYPHALS